MQVTFEDVKNSPEIKCYIRQADDSLAALGFTEHSFAHVMRCADLASRWLLQLGYSEHEAELARIAAYMHDIGNLVNRHDHAQSGALMAFQVLRDMGMPPADLGLVVSAIGNHDEATATPAHCVTAALILADKTDVRRSRVRNIDNIRLDIHDRVNYAVTKGETLLDSEARTLTLALQIDTRICPVAEYFEIFLERMLLCRRAAQFLDIEFHLRINGTALL